MSTGTRYSLLELNDAVRRRDAGETWKSICTLLGRGSVSSVKYRVEIHIRRNAAPARARPAPRSRPCMGRCGATIQSRSFGHRHCGECRKRLNAATGFEPLYCADGETDAPAQGYGLDPRR